MAVASRRLLLSLSLVLPLVSLPAAAFAQNVSVRDDDTASPFPSNRHTVVDFGNATFRRVKLPRPDCAVRVSDCQDIDVINTLDGFSTQPRITAPAPAAAPRPPLGRAHAGYRHRAVERGPGSVRDRCLGSGRPAC